MVYRTFFAFTEFGETNFAVLPVKVRRPTIPCVNFVYFLDPETHVSSFVPILICDIAPFRH